MTWHTTPETQGRTGRAAEAFSPHLPLRPRRCPLYPRKRTNRRRLDLSALCQKPTFALQQFARSQHHFCSLWLALGTSGKAHREHGAFAWFAHRQSKTYHHPSADSYYYSSPMPSSICRLSSGTRLMNRRTVRDNIACTRVSIIA